MLPLLAQSSDSAARVLMNPTFIFFGFVALIVIVPSALHYWAKVRTADSRAMLVQDLAARGMSPEQIREILGAAKLDKDA